MLSLVDRHGFMEGTPKPILRTNICAPSIGDSSTDVTKCLAYPLESGTNKCRIGSSVGLVHFARTSRSVSGIGPPPKDFWVGATRWLQNVRFMQVVCSRFDIILRDVVPLCSTISKTMNSKRMSYKEDSDQYINVPPRRNGSPRAAPNESDRALFPTPRIESQSSLRK